jgi:hypothetical protein
MGLFDNLLSPLTLAGAAEGAVQGREAQIAQQNAEADRAVRASIASTDLLRARNEALAPFRGEITRQLQVHDQYRPYHMAQVMQQFGTANPSDPRVQAEMQRWDQTIEPYRQALATDDPDQVRRIIQNSLQQTGSLPPVAPNPAALASPMGIIQHGTEVPQVIETPGDGLPPVGTPGNPRHNSVPPLPVYGPPLPPGYHWPTASPAATPAASDATKPPVPSIPSPPPGLIPTSPASPPLHPVDPRLHRTEGSLADHLKPTISIPPPSPAPPVQPPLTQPRPGQPTSGPAPIIPSAPYSANQPNAVPGPVAGTGPAGSQNPSQAAGAPFIAQGPDGQPVIRVPGVGDVPTVTAQRVLDQAQQDPAYVAAHKYADYIRQVASLGPIDPAQVEKAVTAEGTAWSTALQRYGELDKMPGDQLNSLMAAYTGEVNAQVAAQKAPSEIALNQATAAKTREETRLLRPKLEQEIQDTIGRNLAVLAQAGLQDAQSQEALARAALQNAQKLNLPAELRIRYIDAVMRGQAEKLKAETYWNQYKDTDQGQADLEYIKKNDAVMAQALEGLGGNGTPINTLNAWMVVRRADTDPNDAVYQRAKQGALQFLQAATASYYGGHPDLVNGPVPTADAWLGYQLIQQRVDPKTLQGNDQDSKDKLNSIRSYRAFEQMMNGGGVGTFPQALGQPGGFTRFFNNLQAAWKKWQENHPGPFNAWGQPDKIRSFQPPQAPSTIAPARPSVQPPPKPGAPYPPSAYPPASP